MGLAKRRLTAVLLALVAMASAGCGGSNSKAPSQPEQQQQVSGADIYACLMKSDVASLVTDASFEPDPMNDYNSIVLVIKTTVEPGHYEGEGSGSAVLGAASECEGDQGTAIAIIDRDGNDMGQ